MKLIIRNSDVKRVLIGVPEGHKHVRIILELQDGSLLEFQEATIANIVRGFITIKTHPQKTAIELINVKLTHRRRGFAEYQLLESEKSPEDVQRELKMMMEGKV